MKDSLKLLENEIVPVYTTSTGEKVVYGRELWKVLQSKQDFSTWMKKRISDCDAIENEDFEVFHKKMENLNGGRPQIEYLIRLDTAKEMAMLERNARGKEVRRYFIEVEKKYKSQAAPPPLSTAEQIKVIAQGYTELDQRITEVECKADDASAQIQEVKREVESRFEELPILGVEERRITSAVSRAALAAVGGKQSNAYNDRSIRAALFSDVYRQLYRNFEISTYKAIKRSQCEKALEVIEGYEPPLMLKGRIDAANAQGTLPGTA